MRLVIVVFERESFSANSTLERCSSNNKACKIARKLCDLIRFMLLPNKIFDWDITLGHPFYHVIIFST